MSIGTFKIEKAVLPELWVTGWDAHKAGTEDQSINWDVYRSDIALCLRVDLYAGLDSESGDTGSIKEFLRDRTLELLDWNTYSGYSLPVTCLVVCDEQDYQEWQKIAEDQEWLRGQISFQIVKSDNDAAPRLDLLLNDFLPDIAKVSPQNDEALAKKLATKAKSNEKFSKEHRELLIQIGNGFQSANAQNLLDQWEQGLEEDYESILESKDE